MARRNEHIGPLLPSPDLRANARDLLQRLDATGDGARFVLWDKQADQPIEINEDVYDLWRGVLFDLSQNRAIQIMRLNSELTTVQAAAFLRVSRPHLIKLLDEGKIKHRMVGTHRRIELAELIAFRDQSKRESREISKQLAEQAQDLGLDY